MRVMCASRPETIESLFVAYRLTGEQRYRDYGWAIFEAIEKHCRIESGGYASILDVNQVPATYEDKMETFLMSETFKYLYLLFEDANVLPLDSESSAVHFLIVSLLTPATQNTYLPPR